MPDWTAINAALINAGHEVPGDARPSNVSGGDISAAWRLETSSGAVFLKTGPASAYDMFSAEAEGLQALAAAGRLFAVGQLEAVAGELGAVIGQDRKWIVAGLASLHRSAAERFGWHRGNTIGLTPQHNQWSDDWVGFFRDHRLGFQLRLAADNGFRGQLQEQGSRLMKRLPVFFESYSPEPSLLHGDLWGGNWASCDGEPVIFDPAVYYGDRETDLAMTRLFGGFGRAFYDAYESAWPLRSGHRERCDLYQLYHVLNHLNLFGSGYLGRAQDLIRRLLRG